MVNDKHCSIMSYLFILQEHGLLLHVGAAVDLEQLPGDSDDVEKQDDERRDSWDGWVKGGGGGKVLASPNI